MGNKTIPRSMVHGTWLLLLGLLLLLSASLIVTPMGAERSSLGETDNLVGVLQQQQPPYEEVTPTPTPEVTPTPTPEVTPTPTPVVAGEVIIREQPASPTPPAAVAGRRVLRLPITGRGLGTGVAIIGVALIVSGVVLLVRGSNRRVAT
jgi:uncharacterized membrane protein